MVRKRSWRGRVFHFAPEAWRARGRLDGFSVRVYGALRCGFFLRREWLGAVGRNLSRDLRGGEGRLCEDGVGSEVGSSSLAG